MTSSDTSVTTSKPMNTCLPIRACILVPSWLFVVACLEPAPVEQDSGDDEVGTLDGEETTEVGETIGAETSETTGAGATETGPENCVDNGDCDNPDAPFCDELSGGCVPCNDLTGPDAACVEADAGTPLCIEGVCVQCTTDDHAACGDIAPFCDSGSNTCVACTEHGQCPDTACNLARGSCIDESNVAYVDGDQACGEGDGSLGAAFCSPSEALESAGDEALLFIHDYGAQYSVALTIDIDVVLFSTSTYAQPRLRSYGDNPAMQVIGSGTLVIRNIHVSGSGGEGVHINGGQAWIERSRIVKNSGGGIVVDGGGSLVLENSFVGGDVDTRAVDIVDGTVDINYTTIVAGFGDTTALFCTDGQGSAVRNSIIISRSDADELVCPDLSVTSSALEVPLGDNAELGPMDITWFSEDFAAGDFSLSGAHPLAIDIAATWLDGDPDTDINGDARPTIDGASDFAGADRIP